MATTQPKPQNDAYTGILFISLLALLGACVMLYLDYEQYGARTPPKGGQLETPKAIDKGSISPTIPNVPSGVAEPKKSEPTTMVKPVVKPRDAEVTSVRPRIQSPPTVPAPIPTLDFPGLPPVPVVTSDEGTVLPAKFETLAPSRPIVDVTPLEVARPVDPMKELETKVFEDVKPTVESKPVVEVKPAAPPSLDDAPPVIRPFVPGK